MPIRPTVQKTIGDKLVTDRRQTTDRQTDRQTDIFELTPIHKGNFKFFFFFAFGRESTNGVKFIPPCSLRKFALLTCFARRGIIINQIALDYEYSGLFEPNRIQW